MLLSRGRHFLRFLHSQFFVTPPYPTKSWKGKVVIVTGANRGLGLEAARHFVRLGASRVVLAVRDLSSGAEAKHDIEQSTTHGGRGGGDDKKGVVDVWHLELSSAASVEAFARRATNSLDRLDALVENAAVATPTFGLTAAGRETTVAVNVVGTFHLALLLLPKLRATLRDHADAGPPHVVVVGTDLIFYTSFPERRSTAAGTAGGIFERLNDGAAARMLARYGVSKLMAAMCVREMVSRASGHGGDDGDGDGDGEADSVVVNYVNPGLCRSDILREATWPGYLLRLVFWARPAEVGARTLVLAADAGPRSKGRYLSDGEVQDVPPFLENEEGAEAQARVWEELVEILEEIHPGIGRYVTGE